VAEDRKGMWNDPEISSTVLAATVVYWIIFSSCVGTFIVGDGSWSAMLKLSFFYLSYGCCCTATVGDYYQRIFPTIHAALP
jgi:hypothetical protein